MNISSQTADNMEPGQTPTSFLTPHSLCIVLPAHNEEEVIAQTLNHTVATISPWVEDFEIVVVNDGSKDQTGSIVKDLATVHPQIRLVDHGVNQGYGAALVSGFTAAQKELIFFMDADGQFDIRDIASFLPLIAQFDAVLGYRLERQDPFIRKFNAWGWKMLTRLFFGLRVHDVDCAFKLFRASFFQTNVLETRGAMINTEILYKLKRSGYTFTQIGVKHLPRQAGKATGAKISVIVRAFSELFFYARKWFLEERDQKTRGISAPNPSRSTIENTIAD